MGDLGGRVGRGARRGLVAIIGNMVSEGIKLVVGTCCSAEGDNTDDSGGGGGRTACSPSAEASTSCGACPGASLLLLKFEFCIQAIMPNGRVL